MEEPDGPRRVETRCCIVDGGPAGMMAGYLLARAGLPVIVFEKRHPDDDDLAAVQARRHWPTRVTRHVQVFMQKRVVSRVLESKGKLSPPLPLGLLRSVPALRRIPARLIGMGVRPEHVRLPPAP